MEIITGGVTAAKGFLAAATAAGIKYKDRMDMAMIVSEVPAVTAGTFTTNVVQAAPVKWDKKIVAEEDCARAVVINAGIANACTGAEGMEYCQKTAEAVEKHLQIPVKQVLTASTGVIGMQLPMDRIGAGVKAMAPKLDGSLESGTAAAKAIMTTDTKKKEAAVTVELGGRRVTIGGMCKGSGMIHPNMCTMLGFVTTDAAISKEMLQAALSEDVKDTYNMVSVDGDTSTNDTCCILANGMAGNPEITEKNDRYVDFVMALHEVCYLLARSMAKDGEGAKHLITCTVRGAASEEQAETISKSVISSTLTKAAIFGCDANWGRVLCAMGYSGEKFDPEKVDVAFASKAGDILVCQAGRGLDFDEDLAKKILTEDEVDIDITMAEGDESCTCWGCDITYDYIKINGDYRT